MDSDGFIALVEKVRSWYPEEVFPSGGDSIEAKSAFMARLTCDNILRELAAAEREEGEDEYPPGEHPVERAIGAIPREERKAMAARLREKAEASSPGLRVQAREVIYHAKHYEPKLRPSDLLNAIAKLETALAAEGEPSSSGLREDLLTYILRRLALLHRYSQPVGQGGKSRQAIRKSVQRTRSKIGLAVAEKAAREPTPTLVEAVEEFLKTGKAVAEYDMRQALKLARAEAEKWVALRHQAQRVVNLMDGYDAEESVAFPQSLWLVVGALRQDLAALGEK